ncbi:MAG: hypothetical protein KAI55_04360, partial [Candidatus Aenigmarchaeota archaeon]|nr:hypothetical protein [Candidatus Aenigmarchaeota archaeon]
MNRLRIILGKIIVLFGAIMITCSVILCVLSFTEEQYEDMQIFKINISDTVENSIHFSANLKEPMSIWLKVQDRELENKNFSINVFFIGPKGTELVTFKENFHFGYYRNSLDNGHYYKLGSYGFDEAFNGNIKYTITGTWFPSYDGFIIMRCQKPFFIPWEEIILFITGSLI